MEEGDKYNHIQKEKCQSRFKDKHDMSKHKVILDGWLPREFKKKKKLSFGLKMDI